MVPKNVGPQNLWVRKAYLSFVAESMWWVVAESNWWEVAESMWRSESDYNATLWPILQAETFKDFS